MNAARAVAYGEYLWRAMPGGTVARCAVQRDELCVDVAPQRLLGALRFLRDHWNARFRHLVDIAAVDRPGAAPLGSHAAGAFAADRGRFALHYCLLSTHHNGRVVVRTSVDELGLVPSAAGLFSSARWAEREVYDMFGVIFDGHPDLRRILTDYGFRGHPLRKDFPLSGHVEVRFDEEAGRVVYEPVQLTQEYRRFELANPWERAQIPRPPVPARDPEPPTSQ